MFGHYSHTYELHSCRHCERIIVTQRQLRTGLIHLPHTRSEAIRAKKDGCTVFNSSYLWSSDHVERRTGLKWRLMRLFTAGIPLDVVKPPTILESTGGDSDPSLQPFFLLFTRDEVKFQEGTHPIGMTSISRLQLKLIGGTCLLALVVSRAVELIWWRRMH